MQEGVKYLSILQEKIV